MDPEVNFSGGCPHGFTKGVLMAVMPIVILFANAFLLRGLFG